MRLTVARFLAVIEIFRMFRCGCIHSEPRGLSQFAGATVIVGASMGVMGGRKTLSFVGNILISSHPLRPVALYSRCQRKQSLIVVRVSHAPHT